MNQTKEERILSEIQINFESQLGNEKQTYFQRFVKIQTILGNDNETEFQSKFEKENLITLIATLD
jgi:hypothetical protein